MREILIIALLFSGIPLGLVFICLPRLRTAGKVILTVNIPIAVFLCSVVALVKDELYFIAIGGGVLLIVGFILLLWRRRERLVAWIVLISIGSVCLIPTAGIGFYRLWEDSVPVLDDGSDDIYWTYSPYNDDASLVSLPEPASLRLDGELPSLDGATALYPVYAAFARAVYPQSEFEKESGLLIDCSTTTGAYEGLIKGETDMIFVASASQKQAEAAAQQGVELTFTPIGREAFVFFVNSKNPLTGLTVEQIQDIYSGKLTEWEQLGVRHLGSIRAFQRDEGSGSQTTLQGLMAGKTLIEAPREDVVDGMGGIIHQVADYRNFRNAIGYSFRFYSTEMVRNNEIKLLEINGVAPTRENIINNTYPIAGDFYAVTTQNSSPSCAAFIEWMLSDEGQYIVTETGYVGIGG